MTFSIPLKKKKPTRCILKTKQNFRRVCLLVREYFMQVMWWNDPLHLGGTSCYAPINLLTIIADG